MLMTPPFARDTLAELTKDSALPLVPNVLLKTKWLSHHGHILVGDNALRAFKTAKWRYDERDIRRAAHALNAITVDPQDLVEIQISTRAFWQPGMERPEEYDWRREMAGLVDNVAFRHGYRTEGWDSSYAIGAHGLPGQITLDQVIAQCENRSIGGLQPLKALTWSGTAWFLPRACADLLDRWQDLDRILADQARICGTCNAEGPRFGGWRQPTTAGFITQCPPCSGEAHQPYTGRLRGTLYTALRRETRADDYLCRLCQASRAFTWDHCHDHGYIRGPVCASCNTYEGKSIGFLERDGGALHLLECRGCREQHTLPNKFHPVIAAAHLQNTERHGRCRSRPWTHDTDLHHGIRTFNLSCPSHGTRWKKQLTTAEIHALTRAFVTATLEKTTS